jgi:hypothetical protein
VAEPGDEQRDERKRGNNACHVHLMVIIIIIITKQLIYFFVLAEFCVMY